MNYKPPFIFYHTGCSVTQKLRNKPKVSLSDRFQLNIDFYGMGCIIIANNFKEPANVRKQSCKMRKINRLSHPVIKVFSINKFRIRK